MRVSLPTGVGTTHTNHRWTHPAPPTQQHPLGVDDRGPAYPDPPLGFVHGPVPPGGGTSYGPGGSHLGTREGRQALDASRQPSAGRSDYPGSRGQAAPVPGPPAPPWAFGNQWFYSQATGQWFNPALPSYPPSNFFDPSLQSGLPLPSPVADHRTTAVPPSHDQERYRGQDRFPAAPLLQDPPQDQDETDPEPTRMEEEDKPPSSMLDLRPITRWRPDPSVRMINHPMTSLLHLTMSRGFLRNGSSQDSSPLRRLLQPGRGPHCAPAGRIPSPCLGQTPSWRPRRPLSELSSATADPILMTFSRSTRPHASYACPRRT